MVWQYQAILILAGIGILNTLYLSWHAVHKTPVRCLFFPPEWCRKVQTSPYSKMFGIIPNAYLGLGMYLAIFALVFLVTAGIAPFWLLGGLVTFGFLFSVYFLYIQAFVLKAFCTWCVLSAIDFFFLMLIVVPFWIA